MAAIKTILPKDIESTIEIPTNQLVLMVITLVDEIVAIKDDHYDISLAATGMVTVASKKNMVITSINHKHIANVLNANFAMTLLIYYQTTKKGVINPHLINYLIGQMHKDDMFISAINKEKINAVELDDIIDFDDDFLVNPEDDSDSYVATEQIISNLMKKTN